jgi:hypothetical protein
MWKLSKEAAPKTKGPGIARGGLVYRVVERQQFASCIASNSRRSIGQMKRWARAWKSPRSSKSAEVMSPQRYVRRRICRGGANLGPQGPSKELIEAIVEIKRRNPRVGCPRIAQEIAHAFGIDINKDIAPGCDAPSTRACRPSPRLPRMTVRHRPFWTHQPLCGLSIGKEAEKHKPSGSILVSAFPCSSVSIVEAINDDPNPFCEV